MSQPPLDEIAAAIAAHQSFVIVSHVGPDGDAIGTGLALRLALNSLGKEARFVGTDGVPVSCRFLPQWQTVVTKPNEKKHAAPCVVIVDCDGTPNRVAAPYSLIERASYKVLIDHHQTSNPIFDTNWIDSSQPATSLMVFKLLKHLGVTLTPDMAQCLLCGMSTDTGHFRFTNTTPETLRAAGELIEAGADSALVAFKLFEERGISATKLLGIALDKMQIECEGTLAWTDLTVEDFSASGTGDEGSENVVNFLRNVRGVKFALIMRERTDETGPVTRVSVRSEPELRADLFSAQFGGGGHIVAAGFRIRHRPFAESVPLIVEAARVWLEREHALPEA